MDNDQSTLLQQAIQVEQNVAKIYQIFSRMFTQDTEFWHQLAIEKNNHAIILESAGNISLYVEGLPDDLLPMAENELREFNNKLTSHISDLDRREIERAAAFNLALTLEGAVGESHYQMLMEKSATTKFVETMQLLNSEDKDHLDRILSYMRENNISITAK